MVITNLLLACRVLVVRLLHRDLIEHVAEVHVDTRVSFDECLELLKYRCKFLGVLFGIFDLLVQPFAVDAVISWEPSSRTDLYDQFITFEFSELQCDIPMYMMFLGNVLSLAVLNNHIDRLAEILVAAGDIWYDEWFFFFFLSLSLTSTDNVLSKQLPSVITPYFSST